MADRLLPSDLGRVIVGWMEDTEMILRGAPHDLAQAAYHEMCELYGLDPRMLPERLRRSFIGALTAYQIYHDRSRKVTHGEIACLYVGVLMAAREYEGR